MASTAPLQRLFHSPQCHDVQHVCVLSLTNLNPTAGGSLKDYFVDSLSFWKYFGLFSGHTTGLVCLRAWSRQRQSFSRIVDVSVCLVEILNELPHTDEASLLERVVVWKWMRTQYIKCCLTLQGTSATLKVCLSSSQRHVVYIYLFHSNTNKAAVQPKWATAWRIHVLWI